MSNTEIEDTLFCEEMVFCESDVEELPTPVVELSAEIDRDRAELEARLLCEVAEFETSVEEPPALDDELCDWLELDTDHAELDTRLLCDKIEVETRVEELPPVVNELWDCVELDSNAAELEARRLREVDID